MKSKILGALIVLISITIAREVFPRPQIEFDPRTYVCYRADTPLKIDGKLDEEAWNKAGWTQKFVDIEGDLKPKPKYDTRVKMLWDNQYLYFGAFLEEPHVWAKLKQRDTVIYYDNDFEVFIDPNSDSHEYYELELNAFNTIWDLLLTKPYRDAGSAIFNWDINGLKSEVYVDGTLNDPDDRDKGWYVEIAYPWSVLKECAHKSAPPKDGDQWRVNFSRVQWQTRVENGKYIKKTNPKTGKHLPENNWVWSPQGIIAMHYPEMWGIVQFSTNKIGSQTVGFKSKEEYQAAILLYKLYYKQKQYKQNRNTYITDIGKFSEIDSDIENYQWPPEITGNSDFFRATLKSKDNSKKIVIDDEGKLKNY